MNKFIFILLTILSAAAVTACNENGKTSGKPPKSSPGAPSGAAVNITRMDHVGINVSDLERSRSWYQKVFGFDTIHTWSGDLPVWMVGNAYARIGLFMAPSGASKISSTDSTLCITHFA